MEKYSDQKRLGRISSNFEFSKHFAHIVHSWWPSNFARCTIVLLFKLNDKSAWRVMFEVYVTRAAPILREQSDFAILNIKNRPYTSRFNKFYDLGRHHENLELVRKSIKQI